MDSEGRGGVCGRKEELQGALCDGVASLDWADSILTSEPLLNEKLLNVSIFRKKR